MAYVRLVEAQSVNVGTGHSLPPTSVVADLASGDRPAQDRGFVVVAGVTSGQGDGSAVTGRREPARQHRRRRKGLSWIRHHA